MKRTSLFIAVAILLSFTVSASSDGAVRCVETEEKKIALTFDDGPSAKYTDEILDILKQYGVKATFFVIGENAAHYPEKVRREVTEGHEVENHTFDHIYLDGKKREEIIGQFDKSEKAIKEITGESFHFIRPPGGRFGNELAQIAEERGYGIVLWSVDTADWKHPSCNEIVRDVTCSVKPGDIILMHDFIGGKPSPTPDALRILIPNLLDEGYEFVTVSELLSSVYDKE